MNVVKKKQIQILANGSLRNAYTYLKKNNKATISEKDHTTFTGYQKINNQSIDSKEFINFKNKYLKF